MVAFSQQARSAAISRVSQDKQSAMAPYYTDIDWTVMKYHVSVDCQELYFSKVRSTEGKYCPEGKCNYFGTADTYFICPGRYVLY